MEKRFQVFISSTYANLKEERRHVMQTLMEIDCISAGMELFPASDDEQFEFIKRVIDDCDYYILIIGGRYGSTTSEGLSYTEKEYEYAMERGLKVLAFIHEKPEEIPVQKSELDPMLREALTKFRTRASGGRLVKFWSDPKELPGLVAMSLMKTIKSYPAIGWVRADKVSNLDLLEEINALRKRNLQLEKERQGVFSEFEANEFNYIWNYHEERVYLTVSSSADIIEVPFLKCTISLQYLLSRLSEIYSYSFKTGSISDYLIRVLKEQNIINITGGDLAVSLDNTEKIVNDLVMFGLAETTYVSPPSQPTTNFARTFLVNSGWTEYVYTAKMHRFKYWLTYHNLLPEHEFSDVTRLIEGHPDGVRP